MPATSSRPSARSRMQLGMRTDVRVRENLGSVAAHEAAANVLRIVAAVKPTDHRTRERLDEGRRQ